MEGNDTIYPTFSTGTPAAGVLHKEVGLIVAVRYVSNILTTSIVSDSLRCLGIPLQPSGHRSRDSVPQDFSCCVSLI